MGGGHEYFTVLDDFVEKQKSLDKLISEIFRTWKILMTRPPPPGNCVHCLEHAERMNWDHVFPKSWYPDTTSHNLEKWKIPSCIPCNKKYGVMEQDFMLRIALCLDPDDSACSGIVTKALRSMDPSKGKNPKDQKRRAKKTRSDFQ